MHAVYVKNWPLNRSATHENKILLLPWQALVLAVYGLRPTCCMDGSTMNGLLSEFAGCMCRECGALCTPDAWEDRGELCGRCAHRSRVAYVNGREIVTTGDDPIRKAIDRAFDNYLRDTGL